MICTELLGSAEKSLKPVLAHEGSVASAKIRYRSNRYRYTYEGTFNRSRRRNPMSRLTAGFHLVAVVPAEYPRQRQGRRGSSCNSFLRGSFPNRGCQRALGLIDSRR